MNLNLDLLAKLMRLTTSTNDAEALLAVRKANEHIAKLGWDWERLLQGKVTIAADPFAGLDFNAMMNGRRKPTYAPQAAPPPRPTYRPPPPPTMQPRTRRNAKPKINLAGLGITI